ncbi:hypothetical protein GCM10009117_04900 [Gangjinia marincola]|uniref:2TM domain-containing protein n=1 Tax=Gangjinia marincola TaxID=578463 RepID=A0ABN1MDZ8_9FLAO
MFSKKKKETEIDHEQRILFEHAQERIKKKKNLYRHFIIFLAGAVLLIVVNLVLGYGKDFTILNTDWFVWAILLWTFVFLIHLLNVFVLNPFIGKKWEEEQLERLVAKQKKKIAALQQEVEKNHPLPEKKTTNDPQLPLPKNDSNPS